MIRRRVDLPEPERPSKATTLEALTNVRKHADAANVEIELTFRDTGLVQLHVHDDGKGAVEETAGSSYGLRGIRERAEQLKGRANYRMAPNEGFTLNGRAARMTGIVIADDQALFREGLRTLLSTRPDMDVVGEAANGDEAVALVEQLRPNVVLMDLRMPKVDGSRRPPASASAGPRSRCWSSPRSTTMRTCSARCEPAPPDIC